MHRGTVRRGLNLLTTGVAFITVATFFADRVSQFLPGSFISAAQVVFFGMFAGGLICGGGILLTLAGALRRRGAGSERLLPSLALLAAIILIFITLAYLSFTTPVLPPLRPGETVTI